MERHDAISLADISAAGFRLRPVEAVTIVRALALQAAQGELPGVPSPHVIRLSDAGMVSVEGPVAAGGRPVVRAAQLLSTLLPPARGGSVSAPLAQVIAHGLSGGDAGSSDGASLHAFAAALAPFAARETAPVVQGLAARWAEAGTRIAGPDAEDDPQAAGASTPLVADVSVMRRARRESGLSLHEVSNKSRIPVPLLRQLEWGYLRHWPTGLYARTQLVRYARAAGLSQQLVMDAVWPMLEEELHTRQDAAAACPGASVEGPQPISIIESSFHKDEVLFEVEESAGQVAATAAIVEEPLPASAYHVADGKQLRPAMSRLADETENSDDAPRRSSMAAAAAMLALLSAGALWSSRATTPSREGAAPHTVRQLPLREQPILSSAAEPFQQQVAAARPVALERRVRIPDAPLPAAATPRAVEIASDEEAVGYTPALASPGGAVFSDLAGRTGESPDDASDLRGGLGLRIARVVDDRSQSYHTRASPDGTRIAFDSDRDGDRAVFVADADGRRLRRVSGEGFAVAPNWSRDGRSLSYARAEALQPEVWNLWTVDLDSGVSRRITANTSGQPLGASWFPDGRRLAYSRGNALVVHDIESATPTAYPSPRPGRAVRAPSVSPDGRWIMFQVAGDGAWLLDTTDTSMRKVMSDASVEEYTWSPDSGRVAYFSRRDAEWSVFVMASRNE